MKRDELNIIYAADDEFAKYMAVSIKSLISNTKTFCNIYIIGNLNPYIEENIKQMEVQDMCKITFVHYNTNLLNAFKDIKINAHLSITTYCRLLAHILLPDISKAIYIDADSIVLRDLSELFNIDLQSYLYAGSEDFAFQYFKNRFSIPSTGVYVNCGILLINLDELRKFDSLSQMTEFALKNSSLIQTGDQDIINGTFYDRIKIISYRYNFYYEQFAKNRKFIPTNRKDYEDSIKEPVIIHFVGAIKPWHIDALQQLNHKYGYFWWYYARQTPFYEEILYKNLKGNSIQDIKQQVTQQITKVVDNNIIKDIANYSKNRFNYYRCRLLANVTFGKMRKHYNNKKKELKAKIKAVRKFLKG